LTSKSFIALIVFSPRLQLRPSSKEHCGYYPNIERCCPREFLQTGLPAALFGGLVDARAIDVFAQPRSFDIRYSLLDIHYSQGAGHQISNTEQGMANDEVNGPGKTRSSKIRPLSHPASC